MFKPRQVEWYSKFFVLLSRTHSRCYLYHFALSKALTCWFWLLATTASLFFLSATWKCEMTLGRSSNSAKRRHHWQSSYEPRIKHITGKWHIDDAIIKTWNAVICESAWCFVIRTNFPQKNCSLFADKNVYL